MTPCYFHLLGALVSLSHEDKFQVATVAVNTVTARGGPLIHYFSIRVVGEKAMKAFSEVKLGSIVGVEGRLETRVTKTGATFISLVTFYPPLVLPGVTPPQPHITNKEGASVSIKDELDDEIPF